MAESVSFKAYLKRDGQEVEVRRFGIDSGAATNFMYLQGKIHSVFPSLQNDQFNLFWQDADNDYVSVGSDEELLEAFTATAVQPLKLYVKPKERQSQVPDDNQTHIGITCDGCEGPVVGRRFKCVTCPDFDLCSKCESAGQHSDHFMLRITSPIGPQMYPKFFRKMFGRPHKFFKHGMDHHMGGHHMGGHHMGGHHMGAGKTRSCPFSQPERPRESRDAAGGVTDMFDFSALMEFINSLGVSMAAGQREGSEPQAQASTSQSAPAQADTSQSAPTQEPRQKQGPANPVAYLSNIGQAITELLDPFGVDVSFEVRPKTTETQEAGPSAPAATEPPRTPNTGSPVVAPASAPSPAVTVLPTPRSTGSPGLVSTPAPASAPEIIEITPPTATARRNSDDWTLLNRESPTRNVEVAAMEVEEGRGAAQPTPARASAMYPELPREVISVPVSSEDRKIEESVDRILAMGFNFDRKVVRDLLKGANCDIASVLEKMLSSKKQ